MFKLTFLSGDVPLTKTIRADGSKTSYPNVKNFTSIEVKVNSLHDFHKVLVEMADSKAKPCLLKGNLSQPLINQPRKGMMPPNTQTHWVCFDLDNAPFSNADEFMRAIGMGDVSYIQQFSSSHGLTKNKSLNCHLFVLLSKAVSPQHLKAWLMHLNLSIPILERAITLSNQRTALHWPLDITTCQNDKLLYIATPIFDGLKDPLPKQRIQYVARPRLSIDITKMELRPIESLKKLQVTKRNDLRKAIGLDAVTHKVKIVEDYAIQPNADEASYDIVETNEEYTRLNLNGGDSGAYWFYNHDFELIRNFKGEDFVYMKDVLPDLYKALKRDRREVSFTPSVNGDRVLAFREKRTGQYWKGLWNEQARDLDIHPIDSKDKLHDFLQGHGVVPPPYVEEWRLVFEPCNPVIVDEENHVVNYFVPPIFEQVKGSYPIIQRCLNSAVGTGEVQEHFLNWLAVIFQTHRKTRTAWILHGTQGTGKGILFERIIQPLLSPRYTRHLLANSLSSDFNGWQEHKLFAFIDEIEVDLFEKKSKVESFLKDLVVAPIDKIHRKGQDEYEAPSYINLMFGSNKPHMIVIPSNDRRFNVATYQSVRWYPTREEIEQQLPKELPAFAHYLMTRKADIERAGSILETEDRKRVQELSISSADELAHDILSGNLSKLADYLPDNNFLNTHGLLPPTAQAYEQIIKNIIVDDHSNLSRDKLQVIFQHCIGKVSESPNRFTSYLKHHGIVPKDIKDRGVMIKGIKVNWKIHDALRADLLKRFQPKLPLRQVK